jgi:hypothetical protein
MGKLHSTTPQVRPLLCACAALPLDALSLALLCIPAKSVNQNSCPADPLHINCAGRTPGMQVLGVFSVVALRLCIWLKGLQSYVPTLILVLQQAKMLRDGP